MKRFIETVVSIKLNACLCFTGLTIICAMVELIWRIPLLTVGWVLQILALSLISGALQYVFYSGAVVKRMSAFLRTACFALLLLLSTLAFALVFHWFPTEEWSAWLIFFGLFIVGFLGVGAGFEIVFRITGQRYTSLLTQAQNQK